MFCALLGGCKTGIDASALQSKEDEQIAQMANTDDIHGPLERFVKAAGWGKPDPKKKLRLVNPPEAMAAYKAAEELMNDKKYDKARDAFWTVAKKYEGYPIREDAVFMTGECCYLAQRYAKAEDKYNLVIKENPTTRHLDDISKRKFEIARIWLNFPDIVTPEDVKPVNFDEPSATPPPQTGWQEPRGISYAVPIIPELWDKRRPLFDTQGRALEALKSIWLNDPTGPLADDALMLSASYYLRKGDFVEADHLYELLRKEFNKSPHLENAFVLGAHAKLMSYQGPDYDGNELEEAEKLIKTTLRLYPQRADRDRMENDLKKIQLAKAAREWSDVKYWKSKGNPKAVAIYCKKVIKKFPDSPYAELAREELAKIRPEDKQDQQQSGPYEEKASSGKAAVGDEPGAFDDPDSRPKKVPNAAAAGQSRM